LRILPAALVATGAILVLAGLYYFDIYTNFTRLSYEEGLDFFTCRPVSSGGETFYAYDADYCIMDFLTHQPFLLSISIPSFALATIGAVAIYFGLRKGKSKLTKESIDT
jgi:hypothetical protein